MLKVPVIRVWTTLKLKLSWRHYYLCWWFIKFLNCSVTIHAPHELPAVYFCSYQKAAVLHNCRLMPAHQLVGDSHSERNHFSSSSHQSCSNISNLFSSSIMSSSTLSHARYVMRLHRWKWKQSSETVLLSLVMSLRTQKTLFLERIMFR